MGEAVAVEAVAGGGSSVEDVTVKYVALTCDRWAGSLQAGRQAGGLGRCRQAGRQVGG